ncbi:MAG: ribosome silencing factor [Anaerolineales bacterium]|nr:ribosome silencing factor [Anaerolineales bacterium]
MPVKLIFTWRCYLESLELAHLLVDTILEKKGSDITILDLREQALFADYFLLCNGENERQLGALASSIVEDAKKKAQVRPIGVEGEPQHGWMLVDFGDLIVHIFAPARRSYYRLEELWSQAYTVLEMQ